MEQMVNFSRIGRPLDPRYPTNLVIMIWSAIVMVAVFGLSLISGNEFVQAGIAGVLAGLTVFYSWALAREIDPQEQLSAFVATLFMTIAVFVVDAQYNLIVLFYLLSLSRIVNRVVGLPATLLDSIFLLIATMVVGFLGSWIYAMIGASIFLLDSLLPQQDRKQLLFAGLSTGVMIAAFITQNSQLNPMLPTIDYIIAIVIVTLMFLPVVIKSKQVNAKTDATNEPLIPLRIQATQVMILLCGYHVAVWQGNSGVLELLPLWITIAGVAIFPLVKPFLPEVNLSPRNRN